MRGISICSIILGLWAGTVSASWQKIGEVDYVWGPFKIYNLSLFTETGQYQEHKRPLMLTLHYAKPVDGRDFAISLARSWANLGIKLENQDDIIDRLRKIMPNIRKNDKLSYIALEDKGYFVLNDMVIDEEFSSAFNDAIVSIWLDPRVEIGRKLVNHSPQENEQNTVVKMDKPEAIIPEQKEENSVTQTVENPENLATENTVTKVENSEVKPESSPAPAESTTPPNDEPNPNKEEGVVEGEPLPLTDPLPQWEMPTS